MGDGRGHHRAQRLAPVRRLPELARLRRAAPLLLLGLAAPPLLAQSADPHAAQPERPTVATHAGTVAPGWLEVETGVEFDRFRDRTHAMSVPTTLKFGLARPVQLTVTLPFVSHTGATFGAGDFSAGLKWRLVDRGGIVGRFALLPAVKVPTGSSSAGRGTGTTDVSLLLVSSHALGPVAMDLNAGITRRSGDGTVAPRTATVWTASFGYPVKGRLGGVGEIYGYPATTGPAGSPGIVGLTVGPTWQARDWLVFDAGMYLRISGPQPRGIFAGLTWNAGRYWPGGGGG